MDDATAEAAILDLLSRRRPGASICPSEAARAVAADWRPLMPELRAAAARLAARGVVVVTQRGDPVDAATARGPIRLSRRR
jgi:hypothetical protein